MSYVFFGCGGAWLGAAVSYLLAFPICLLLEKWTDLSPHALIEVVLWLSGIGAVVGLVAGIVSVYKAESKLKQK